MDPVSSDPNPKRSLVFGIMLTLVLVASVFAILVMAGDEPDGDLVGSFVRASEDESSSSSDREASSSVTTDPGDTDSRDTSPFTILGPQSDSGQQEVIEELMGAVEKIRGLPFLHAVELTLLSDEEFRQRLLHDLETEVDPDEILLAERAWKALGLIGPQVDLYEALLSAYGGSVLGFYDPETGELVMRGVEMTPFVQGTLVHELTHALDDQHFNLDRPEFDEDDADTEASFGFTVLVEGSASWAEARWQAGLSASERAELAAEEAEFGADIDISALPMALLIDLWLPYQFGPLLVEDIVAAGGLELLDAAFIKPPVSGEQVLHPSAFLGGDVPILVPPPPAGGAEAGVQVLDSGVLGASTILEMLYQRDPEYLAVADDWGGDSYVLWADGDRSCLRADIVADGPGGFDRLTASLSAWAEHHGNADIELLGDTMRLTACG
jgi:hypothetical protein